LAVQRRLTIGGIQILEGRRLVGFEFEARRGTISGIQISEGLRLVGFEFEARRGTIGGIQISEGLRLVGFTNQLFVRRIYSSSVKNAGNTGKKREKLSPFHFRFRCCHFRSLPVMSFLVTSGDVIFGDATSVYSTSGDVISGDDPPHDLQQM
jgi:hypothetical protein